jgi:hypothetical protein
MNSCTAGSSVDAIASINELAIVSSIKLRWLYGEDAEILPLNLLIASEHASRTSDICVAPRRASTLYLRFDIFY